MLAGDRGQELQHQFCTLGFPGTRFATNYYALVATRVAHIRVGIIGKCEDMRRQFANPAVSIQADMLSRIDWQVLIWIYGHQYRTGIGLNMGNV